MGQGGKAEPSNGEAEPRRSGGGTADVPIKMGKSGGGTASPRLAFKHLKRKRCGVGVAGEAGLGWPVRLDGPLGGALGGGDIGGTQSFNIVVPTSLQKVFSMGQVFTTTRYCLNQTGTGC